MNNYLIFDVNEPIMNEPIVEIGKSNADAARRYAAKKYPNKKIKASGCNFVQISAQECKIENGKTYRLGWKRTTWFKIENKDEN